MTTPHMDTDTEDIFWAMLMDLESCTTDHKDILRKMLVESAYRHWNITHPDSIPKFPRWIKG